jgi:preprotein translocase subunit SecA
MMARIDNETVRYLFNVQVQMEGQQPPQAPPGSQLTPPQTGGARPLAAAASAAARASEESNVPLPAFAREMERKQQRQEKEMQLQAGTAASEAPKPVRAGAKIGRNDPCPCGSGKKYKKCHGVNF